MARLVLTEAVLYEIYPQASVRSPQPLRVFLSEAAAVINQ